MLPDDRDGLQRLARYPLRAPVSLERLSFDAASDQIAYAKRPGRGHEPGRTAGDQLTDPRELPARVPQDIPEPRRHVTRYFGAYSNAARAGRVKETAVAGSAGAAVAPPPPGMPVPINAAPLDG